MKLEDVMNPKQRFVATVWAKNRASTPFVASGIYYGETALKVAETANVKAEQLRRQYNSTHEYTVTVGEFTQVIEPPVPPLIRLIEI